MCAPLPTSSAGSADMSDAELLAVWAETAAATGAVVEVAFES